MAEEPEHTICQIITALTGKEILVIGQLDQNEHIFPLLLQIDSYHFETALQNKSRDWQAILDEVGYYLEDFEIYQGLAYNHNENLSSPSRDFLISISAQILAIHWLSCDSINELLPSLQQSQIQAFTEAVSDMRKALSEAMAKEFINVRRISHGERSSMMTEQELVSGRTHANSEIRVRQNSELKDLISTSKKDNQRLVNENQKLQGTIEIKNQEIDILREISDKMEQEKNKLKSQLFSAEQVIKAVGAERQLLADTNAKLTAANDHLSEEIFNVNGLLKKARADLGKMVKLEEQMMAQESIINEYYQIKNDREMFIAEIEAKKKALTELQESNFECKRELEKLNLILAEKTEELDRINSQNLDLRADELQIAQRVRELEQEVRILRNETKMQAMNTMVKAPVVIDKRPMGLSKEQSDRLNKKIEDLERQLEQTKKLVAQKELERQAEIEALDAHHRSQMEEFRFQSDQREDQLNALIAAKTQELEQVREFLTTKFTQMNNDIERLKRPPAKPPLSMGTVQIARQLSRGEQPVSSFDPVDRRAMGVQVDPELSDFHDKDSKHLLYSTIMQFAVSHMESFKDLDSRKHVERTNFIAKLGVGRLGIQ